MNTIYESLFGRDPSHPKIEVMWETLEATTVFTIKELKRLFARYLEICDTASGELAMHYFVQMPELVHCPFARIAFERESLKHTNPTTIDFTIFVRILSKLSLKTLPTEKVDYLCETLGSAEEGTRLDKEDFKALLTVLWSGTISDEMIEPLVDAGWNNIMTNISMKRNSKHDENEGGTGNKKEGNKAEDPDDEDTTTDGNPEETITRGELTTYLSSLDLQNFITVQF